MSHLREEVFEKIGKNIFPNRGYTVCMFFFKDFPINSQCRSIWPFFMVKNIKYSIFIIC